MSKSPCDKSQKVCAVSDVTLNPQSMLMQLAMPLDPRDTIKARRERAIRRSGLTPSKGYRLWYGLAELWRHEYQELLNRYERHIISLERQYADKSETLRHIREARELRERHYALALDSAVEAGAGSTQQHSAD